MSEYIPTIGLEIHAELKTKTKMFCNSKNDPDEKRPNVHVCPVCMGHPGTLPTINKEAVKHILKVGIAVGGTCADFTEFDRKNYFYPDIPKGYQISQYEHPLVKGGTIKDVELTRIHLEEDTAKSYHKGDYSLIDFNRAGIPLMELVTEPVIENAGQAGDFARELQLLLRTLGVADANMEKGEMRVEANISVRKKGEKELGTKVEVKNLNSFRSVEGAIDYEIKRHINVLEGGREIIQETRGWDEKKQETFSQRIKETSEDYRYFPDPDLPKLSISEIDDFRREKLEKELPELPWEKRERLIKEYGIKQEDVEQYVSSQVLGEFFENVIKAIPMTYKPEAVLKASNYISSDLVGLLENFDTIPVSPEYFADLIVMIEENMLSSRGAKDVLAIIIEENDNRSPRSIAEERELLQVSDESALKAVVEKIIEENKEVAEDYKNGNEQVLKYFVGQGMKETKGSANPQALQELFRKALS